MKPVKEDYLPRPELSTDEMKEMQRNIGAEAVFRDHMDFRPEEVKEKVVVGIDQAFTEAGDRDSRGAENQRFSEAVSAAVAMQNGEIIEKVHAVTDLEIPYIPGLLAFREGEPIVAALEKLSVEPDILVLDGSGRIHFREAGIATHIGVMFDIPSIGVAKNLLCGSPVEEIDSLEEGYMVKIVSDNSMETAEKAVIGYAFQSRQYPNSLKINPLYVSPGHRISAETSVDIVERLCDGYKLPEPTLLADKYVDKVRQKL